MIRFAIYVGIVATVAAFLISLADKWGWREWLQVHADDEIGKRLPKYEGDFFNRLFSCNFCCSWWAGVVLSLTLWAVSGDAWALLVPFCSTIITRNLL